MPEPATADPVRWGLLGTASITRKSFLPGLADAGGGTAYAVAGRDPERTRAWAAEQSVEHATRREELLADPAVDAVYVPLPNSLHADWTIAALQAGKAVLCEKPLCRDPAETGRVLAAARETGGLLWEAFVFPFNPQLELVQRLMADGTVGDVLAVHAEFHFPLHGEGNIRLDPGLAGGALNDVGCYPIRLARLVLGAEPVTASARKRLGPSGVDTITAGCLTFPGDRELLFSCGFERPLSTFSRIVGTRAELRLSNPYHPTAADTVQVWRDGALQETYGGPPLLSFAYGLQHIHDVIRGRANPRHLAVDDAAGNAAALAAVRAAAAADTSTDSSTAIGTSTATATATAP